MTGRRKNERAAAWASIAVLAMAVCFAWAAETKPADKLASPRQVPETRGLLTQLKVDPPRTHENMMVFPIRWGGKQAPGKWETLDQAVAAGRVRITEKENASVPEVVVENTGDLNVLLMSGEIIKGGKQTRVIRKDTILEPKQKVNAQVFCVEQSRWAGKKGFTNSKNAVPASIRDKINRGASQGSVWSQVRQAGTEANLASPTGSLDEMLDSKEVKSKQSSARKSLGKFSPPDTIGIAIADKRSGRVIGLELFGRRDLFDALQTKLIEGYNMDLVILAEKKGPGKDAELTAKDVEAFIAKALAGTSKYEDTAGSGRGIDLKSGTLNGKGVALGSSAIHISIQDARPETTPARPIVRPDARQQQGWR